LRAAHKTNEIDTMNENQNDEKKTTNEKPVSLFPLDFKEALAALLKVKPKPKEDTDKAIKQKEKKSKKSN